MKNRYKNKRLAEFVAIVGFIGVCILLGMSTIVTIIFSEPFIIIGITIGVLYICFGNAIMFYDEKEEAHKEAVKFYDKWIKS